MVEMTQGRRNKGLSVSNCPAFKVGKAVAPLLLAACIESLETASSHARILVARLIRKAKTINCVWAASIRKTLLSVDLSVSRSAD